MQAEMVVNPQQNQQLQRELLQRIENIRRFFNNQNQNDSSLVRHFVDQVRGYVNSTTFNSQHRAIRDRLSCLEDFRDTIMRRRHAQVPINDNVKMEKLDLEISEMIRDTADDRNFPKGSEGSKLQEICLSIKPSLKTKQYEPEIEEIRNLNQQDNNLTQFQKEVVRILINYVNGSFFKLTDGHSLINARIDHLKEFLLAIKSDDDVELYNTLKRIYRVNKIKKSSILTWSELEIAVRNIDNMLDSGSLVLDNRKANVLDVRVTQLNTIVANLRNTNATLSTDKTTFSNENTRLMNENNNLRDENQILKNENENLQREISRLKSSQPSNIANAEIKKLNEENENLKVNLITQKDVAKKLAEENGKLINEKSELTQRVTYLENELAIVKEVIMKMSKHYEEEREKKENAGNNTNRSEMR